MFNVELFTVVYILFCSGFGFAYGQSDKTTAEKVGVGVIATILCPFIIGAGIYEYLNLLGEDE